MLPILDTIHRKDTNIKNSVSILQLPIYYTNAQFHHASHHIRRQLYSI